ncbi:ABC transporter ATP-binding protein [Alcaligenes endophyticus]|uniref:ABC transporter ATP-binding protein n=1 Tax=Alcaligenes endophyticus TaxID=1929088 RepID=A0ABT8ELY2_9BURK|nr:ABC transporter ATP-binding protein [Alcaligenes endophyticus]MCX5591222.1 ABC transporter ATP-binding protein [Alcaligenes endophyticus]MDN4122200.1 ABC transporter ATP-binding protein [Alcaligenes endophyticus]
MSQDILLKVDNVHAHYDKSHVLHGVSLEVAKGETISLIGRNGSGRSTTLKAIMGLLPPSSGSVQLNGRELAGRPAYEICRAGIAYVPEEREVFANLTVEENLRMGEQAGVDGTHKWSLQDMFDYFPRLKERRNTYAGSLSGGEQQMLTMCRSLLGNPQLILIDEPTEGLAPMIVAAVGECIQDIHRKGVAVILVEQKLAIALKVSSRMYVMGQGCIVYEGSPHEIVNNEQLLADWLAV